MKVGDIVVAKIKTVEEYGLFLDTGGIEVFVKIPDVTWEKIPLKLEDIFHVGDELKVKLISQQEKTRFTGSIREVFPEKNPWKEPFPYGPGTVLRGKIIEVLPYGYLISVGPGGIDGVLVLNVSADIHNKGDFLDVVVENVDVQHRQITFRNFDK